MRVRDPQTDAADPVAVLERKLYSLFVIHSELAIFVDVIHDEGPGGETRQHVCHGRVVCANEAEIQVGWRRKYDSPPSLADVRELIPPAFPAPFSPFWDTGIVNLVLQGNWSVETKDIEERIVVKGVDRCTTRWSVTRRLG